MNNILVTGGVGFIGSHTCVQLLQAGFDVSVIDNLSNSHVEVVQRITKVAKRSVSFTQVDIRDESQIEEVFAQNTFDAVIHFAGLKAVGESSEKPLSYYNNNVNGTLNLLKAMQAHNCFNLVFSSSATVYGDPASVPIKEEFPLSATNPYGRTKLMIEEILRDLAVASSQWNISILRYFNPVAAHPSGLLGEDPSGIPNNLMPYVAQVAIGKLSRLSVFGNEFDTPDGTGVRDYIHVMDLADAHVNALQSRQGKQGCKAYNIGTGQGYSVLQMVKAFELASGVSIPYDIKPRRAGDVATCYSDPELANTELGWQAKYDLNDMMRDHWNWQSNNPNGYSQTG